MDVVLLRDDRAADDGSGGASYADKLGAHMPADARLHFVPVLDTRLVPFSAQQQHSTHSAIVTSQRAVVALESGPQSSHHSFAHWFVVGPTTRDRLQRLLDGQGASQQKPAALIQCADSARQLVPLILARLSAGSAVTYFCGRARRDEIPAALLAARVECREVVVYETCARTEITLPVELGTGPVVVVFFSPSGVDAAWDAVERLLQSRPRSRSVITCAVCIGPTTFEHLTGRQGDLHFTAVAVADAPTAAGIASAIKGTVSRCRVDAN